MSAPKTPTARREAPPLRGAMRRWLAALLTMVSLSILPSPSAALEPIVFRAEGVPGDLKDRLVAASLLIGARRDGVTAPDELLAAAQADYARLLGAFYEAGYYGPVIRIRVNGTEAADILPLDAPETIRSLEMDISPGPRFVFGRAAIGPLGGETRVPEGYARGRPAGTGIIRQAAEAAIDGWRSAGHASAAVSAQSIVADHRARQVFSEIRLDPGPLLRFGTIGFSGATSVREDRLRKMAGLPTGQIYDPEDVRRVGERLRRSGVFRTVSVTEVPRDDGTLDLSVQLADQPPRRFGFGAEVATDRGLTLSGFWLHRNLLGGAERVRVEGEVSGIGGETGGIDYATGVVYTRPATPSPDTDLRVFIEAEQKNEPDFTSKTLSFGLGFRRIVRDDLTAELGIRLASSRISDDFGDEDYAHAFLPYRLTLDRRENPLNTDDGYYADGLLEPFAGLGGSESGVRFTLDARAYEDFGPGNRFVLAGRVQLGSIFGASIEGLPNDMRFYSGGGGTVRGQEYQSLDVALGGGRRSGGRSFLGATLELRTRLGDDFSLVTFADWARIGEGSLPGASGESHSGAGLGIRYDTGIGPLRLDVGVPLSGTPGGSDYHFYIGIGQAF